MRSLEFALDCPPFAMVCAGFMESSETTFVWVADKAVDGEWHRAKVVQQSTDGSVTVETLETNEQVETTSEKLLLANELPEEGVEDMTRLNYLHEPALLNNLRHRFGRDHVYTYTGKICIAVNPFNWQVSQPLYAESVLLRYRGREFGDLAPHVYAIAEDAYQQIVSEERNQSSAYASSLVSLPPLPMYSLPQKPYLATSLCQSPLATACACTTHFTPQRRRSASLSPLCSCLLLALASPRLRREWRRQDRVCEDHDAVFGSSQQVW